MAVDPQLVTLRVYGALCSLREQWGGALVLACGEDARLVAAAVGIAGGVCLVVSEDAAEMKAALRRGEIDFVVNTLDEALRTMKNEVRQKRSLGVACIGELAGLVVEMVERGVQPELGFCADEELEKRGMREMTLASAEELGLAWAKGNGWAEVYISAKETMPAGADSVRERWLRRAPQYLRNATREGRWIWADA